MHDATIALLAAMREEMDGLREEMGLAGVSNGLHWRLLEGEYEGRKVLLMQTGPGRKRAEGAADLVMERYPIACLVSIGFAGALVPGLKVADILLCRELACADSAHTGLLRHSDPGILSLAKDAVGARVGRLRVGRAVTVEKVASRSEEKKALGEAFGAQVADMESYWLAGRAAARGVPFLAVRAVSDALAQTLPPFDQYLSPEGGWLWRRTVLGFLRNPADLARLPRLYLNALRARRSLTRVVGSLLPRL